MCRGKVQLSTCNFSFKLACIPRDHANFGTSKFESSKLACKSSNDRAKSDVFRLFLLVHDSFFPATHKKPTPLNLPGSCPSWCLRDRGPAGGCTAARSARWTGALWCRVRRHHELAGWIRPLNCVESPEASGTALGGQLLTGSSHASCR